MARRMTRAPRGRSQETSLSFMRLRSTEWGTQARVLIAKLFGVGNTGDAEDEQESEEQAEVFSPLGLDAVPAPSTDPADTVEAVCARDGDETHVLFIVNKGLPRRGTALVPGEVSLHGARTENVTADVWIKANGDIVVTPKSGQKVYLGGEGSTQPAMGGVDLKAYLDELAAKINLLRTDMQLVKSHVHGAMGAAPSPTLALIPSGTGPGASPANSTIVEVKL